MKNRLSQFTLALLGIASIGFLSSCDRSTEAEKAAEEIEKAAEEIGDGAKEAAEEAGETFKKAIEEAEDVSIEIKKAE